MFAKLVMFAMFLHTIDKNTKMEVQGLDSEH